nr:unnamed protein product [Callosobruchus chinensis]
MMCLFPWFKCQPTRNVPITGSILRQKANEFAIFLKRENFQCSEGWINIVFGRCGSVKVRKGYSNDDIFNVDEAGLFYKITCDKTMRFKGEKCPGGKMSKEIITIMVAANMSGSEKEDCYWKI